MWFDGVIVLSENHCNQIGCHSLLEAPSVLDIDRWGRGAWPEEHLRLVYEGSVSDGREQVAWLEDLGHDWISSLEFVSVSLEGSMGIPYELVCCSWWLRNMQPL